MNNLHTNAEKVAAGTTFIGLITVLVMPFLSVPFRIPYPVWALTPMEHAIYLLIVSVLVLIVGVPASIISIRQKHNGLGWISLSGCVLMWPLGIAAIYAVALLFGENINIH